MYRSDGVGAIQHRGWQMLVPWYKALKGEGLTPQVYGRWINIERVHGSRGVSVMDSTLWPRNRQPYIRGIFVEHKPTQSPID